jgi:stage II sporulation protein M
MKKNMRSNFIAKHIGEYSSLYIFHTVLLIMGVIFGAIVVNSLSITQKDDLFYFINEFFTQVVTGEIISAKETFIHSISYNIKFVGLMWILGMTMIGLPVIFILLFLKGMVVGFTIGFLVQQMGWKGFFLSFVSVLPQNLIIIPVFIAVAVISVSFSLQLIRKLFVKSVYHQPIGPMLVQYCLFFGAAILLLVFAAFIEGYLTPYFMKGILSI